MKNRKHDFNIFTKKELVDFLNKNEVCCLQVEHPFDAMIEKKIENLEKKIRLLSKQEDKRNENKDITATEQLESVFVKIKADNKWLKLHSEHEKLIDIRYDTARRNR